MIYSTIFLLHIILLPSISIFILFPSEVAVNVSLMLSFCQWYWTNITWNSLQSFGCVTMFFPFFSFKTCLMLSQSLFSLLKKRKIEEKTQLNWTEVKFPSYIRSLVRISIHRLQMRSRISFGSLSFLAVVIFVCVLLLWYDYARLYVFDLYISSIHTWTQHFACDVHKRNEEWKLNVYNKFFFIILYRNGKMFVWTVYNA